MYVWYGTNEYNFEKLENPPSFEPTHCARCGKRINLGEDGYSIYGDRYTCEECMEIGKKERIRSRTR
jgi:recombinational DNA repair protein (RecF pathway)